MNEETFHCEVCLVSMNNQKLYQQHVNTDKHRECVEFKSNLINYHKNSEIVCEMCCLKFNSVEPLQQHIESAKHKKKVDVYNQIHLNAKSKSEHSISHRPVPYHKINFNPDSKNDISKLLNELRLEKENIPDGLTALNEILNPTETDESVSKKIDDSYLAKNFIQTNVSSPCKYSCKLCNVTCNSDFTLKRHVDSNGHISMLKKQPSPTNLFSPFKQAESQSSSIDAKVNENYTNSNWCDCCYVEYSSDKHRLEHNNGKEHSKRRNLKENLEKSVANLKKSLYCDVCYCLFNSEEQGVVHLTSPAHVEQSKKLDVYKMSTAKSKSESTCSLTKPDDRRKGDEAKAKATVEHARSQVIYSQSKVIDEMYKNFRLLQEGDEVYENVQFIEYTPEKHKSALCNQIKLFELKNSNLYEECLLKLTRN